MDITMKPHTIPGAVHWVALGAGAALVALLVGSFFPSIIPARAASTRL